MEPSLVPPRHFRCKFVLRLAAPSKPSTMVSRRRACRDGIIANLKYNYTMQQHGTQACKSQTNQNHPQQKKHQRPNVTTKETHEPDKTNMSNHQSESKHGCLQDRTPTTKRLRLHRSCEKNQKWRHFRQNHHQPKTWSYHFPPLKNFGAKRLEPYQPNTFNSRLTKPQRNPPGQSRAMTGNVSVHLIFHFGPFFCSTPGWK